MNDNIAIAHLYRLWVIERAWNHWPTHLLDELIDRGWMRYGIMYGESYTIELTQEGQDVLDSIDKSDPNIKYW